MIELTRILKRFIDDERGQTPLENVGLACLVVLICVKFGPQICIKSVDLLLRFLLPIWSAL